MEEIAIEASNLGKRLYRGTRAETALLPRLMALAGGVASKKAIWAVRGINLRIRRGECVGIVGPNGAGKSTLLALLGGLVEPTEGSVKVAGKISPFFDIGSGLHAELTVLDNIRLAAALFGMTRDDARRRLDAIIAFGELEEYLYARLGELSVGYQSRVPFSTALHSDIDILLTDEVFSVGDASFSLKCMARMKEMMGRGKTVVMASHNMDLVLGHCTRVISLERGALVRDGLGPDVVSDYLARQGLS